MNHDSGALATVFYCFLAHNLYFVAYSVLVDAFLEFVLLFLICLESAWAVGFSHFLFCIMTVLAVHSQGCLLCEPLTSIVDLIMEKVHDFDCTEWSGK